MKVFLDMVGCRLNQSELESYARQFRLAGHTLASDAAAADMIVINTCAVTSAAASDSRQKIRQAKRSTAGQIIVTGCWSSLNTQEAAALPGVTRVIGNLGKDNLVPLALGVPIEGFNHRLSQRTPIPGSRLRTRAFIKVQDGCDNHCTFCITRIARGASKSRPVHDVLEDIQCALSGGAQEAVLTGVHLGSWGYDFMSPTHLMELIKAILADTDIPRLRLSSLEPWDIPADFFRLWQNRRVCRHLHLPLQSGSEATLKRMGRRITPQAFARLVEAARANIPGIAITTDIITGFPGETEAEFAESADFVKRMDFSSGHVFTYSPRPGTPASRFSSQVPHLISKQRSAHMRAILKSRSAAFRERHLGCEMEVLWEKAVPIDSEHWQLSGLSDNYLRVRATAQAPHHNQVMKVRFTDHKNGELVGEFVDGESHLPASEDTL